MKVVRTDLSLIDFNDLTFFTGNIQKHAVSALGESIKKLGLINPPVLREKEGGYRIVTGWKRLSSCVELGHTHELCGVFESEEISDEDCLQIQYQDNRDRITELELSEIVARYRGLSPLDDREFLKTVLPSFGIPPARKHLDKYLALAALDKAVKDAFYEEKITVEQAQMLSGLKLESQPPVLTNMLLKYKLNNNETRQVTAQIEEIALIDLKSAKEVIFEAESAIGNEKAGKNELRQQLRRMRYPNLSKTEEAYRNQVDNMSLPKEVNLFVNQFFEGNDIELRLKVKSSKELSKILSSLEDSIVSGEIDKLLRIIKHGSL